MKSYSLLLIAVFLPFMSFSQQNSSTKLLWSEDFNYSGLPDSANWTYDVGDHGWGNQELQYYSKNELKNARVEEGVLIIEAHRDLSKPKEFTSARLVTRGKAAWQYGYIEVKAKLPEGRGTWPAIWMLPEENRFGGWPKNGEIDIMEHVGYDSAVVHGTVHTGAFNHIKGTQKGNQLQVPTFHDEFHTYAIDWRADRIDFFIDGHQYFSFKNNGGDYMEWPFDQPFHLILNLAVGGGWGGRQGVDTEIWPQRMEVDYIRVFDKNPY